MSLHVHSRLSDVMVYVLFLSAPVTFYCHPTISSLMSFKVLSVLLTFLCHLPCIDSAASWPRLSEMEPNWFVFILLSVRFANPSLRDVHGNTKHVNNIIL